MTWADYNRYSFGKLKRDSKEWEHTRLVVSMLYNANVGKKHDQKKPEDILKLWTDNLGKTKKPKQEPLTKEAFQEVVKKLDNNG
jgi:hypothetical protein